MCDQVLIVQRLDQMGPFHILLDEMGLDQMGLDEMRRPQLGYSEARWEFVKFPLRWGRPCNPISLKKVGDLTQYG